MTAQTIDGAENQKVNASVALKTTGEIHNDDVAEGDVILTPKASVQTDAAKLAYSGTFRRTADSTGNKSDLQTLVQKLSISNDTWDLTLGRNSLRNSCDTTTTVGFDNYVLTKGVGRTFTGAFLGHQPSGLTVGLASSDAQMNPTHWDTLIGNWSYRFRETARGQAHIASKFGNIDKVGLAIELQPTEKTSILADAICGRKESTAMIAGNLALCDRIKLFAGSEITAPRHGNPEAKIVAGAESDIGHGLRAITAVQQDISSANDTTFVLGLKFNATKTLLK